MEKVNVILSRQETKLLLFFYFINNQNIVHKAVAHQNTHKAASTENQWATEHSQPTTRKISLSDICQ